MNKLKLNKIRIISDVSMELSGKMFFRVKENYDTYYKKTGFIPYEEVDGIHDQLLADFIGIGINE